MNTRRLRRVARAILKHPEHYNQGTYWDDHELSSVGTLTERRLLGKCGTQACVAGWAVALYPDEARAAVGKRRLQAFDIPVAAAKILGLRPDEGGYPDLFDVRWTYARRAQAMMDRATTPLARAKAAVARIEYLIKTGR